MILYIEVKLETYFTDGLSKLYYQHESYNLFACFQSPFSKGVDSIATNSDIPLRFSTEIWSYKIMVIKHDRLMNHMIIFYLKKENVSYWVLFLPGIHLVVYVLPVRLGCVQGQ